MTPFLRQILFAAIVVSVGGAPVAQGPADDSEDPAPESTPFPDDGARPATLIQSADLPAAPVAGMGRLSLVLDGNRRWCTFKDDRLMPPRARPGAPAASKHDEIFTFGYQMVLGAVRRGAADTSLVLFESPVYRTAEWRPASKAGMAPRQRRGPTVVSPDAPPPKMQRKVAPDTLVPFWLDQYRCVTVDDRFDFDLAPGTYDLYLAFDMLNREGGWVHRMSSFVLDVPVEPGRATQVDGRVHFRGGQQREVELIRSAILPATGAQAGAGAP